ncbi:ankyrin repeat-containing domain protein, partial [Parasitella parasitica]
TPLHEASRHGHQEIVNLLINAGADVNMEDKAGKTPYHVSTAFPTIRQILTARMDEVRLQKEACNALDEIATALSGHFQVVKILLEYGADVNSKGADLDTPLHDATENNHCDIVELLLEHGADPFARNVHDTEPID